MLGGPPSEPVAGSSGVRLGKYELIRRLAVGGMAELFLARATAIHGFEKLVVLKRILPQHAESSAFIRMFLDEARLAATLHHPNIVQVFDIGEDGGTYFFTMEYVQGQDLRQVFRAARKARTPLPLEHILHVVTGVAAGLHHAHEKIGHDGRALGIVHRDVSPSNVLITYEGGIKVVDFGIAKAASAQTSTVAGTLKGKVPYMSPEQCRGEVVDRRSDIFSIGTLLWELTTGQRLFGGDNDIQILNRVGSGDVVAPSTIRPDYPPELEAIVMRALQPDRDQRYASALDLQIDLEDFAREARLPVSSARMSKFMHGLFAEEIRASQVQVPATPPGGGGLEEQPTAPRPTLDPAMLGAGAAAIMGEGPESIDLTPSEVRAHHVQYTPGPDPVYASGSATDIGYVASRRRGSGNLWVVVGVVGGVMAALGLAVVVYMVALAEDEGSSEATPAAAPTATAPEDGVAIPAQPVDPVVEDASPAEDGAAEDGAAEPDPAGAPGSPEDDGAGELDEAADGDVDPGDDDTEESSSSASDVKNDEEDASGSDRSTRRSGQRRSGQRSGSKRSSRDKPQWDPDSPFPI